MDEKDIKKTIKAVGHSSSVTLTMRDNSKDANMAVIAGRGVTRKPKIRHDQRVRLPSFQMASN